MKSITFLSILFSIACLSSFEAIAQNRLVVEGTAVGSPLARLAASDISAANDLLEIEAPSSPASTSGQFIECQVGGSIKMQVNYDGSSFFTGAMNINSDIFLNDEGANSSAEISIEDNSNNETILIRAKDGASDIGGEILLRGGVGAPTTIEIDGNWAGTGFGRIRTDELEIEGGSDIAEHFGILPSADHAMPQPGMLVSIHPEHAGQLSVTTNAYDTKVAGVISGANGVRTGMYMGQSGSIADGDFPVALAGRVYVMADASFGAIKPGDLLTSSPTPGHAMKVKNHKKARGAIVGKAMTGLENGKDFVLVLVTLQ